MKKSIKLALRASEIRSDINKLPAGEDSVEKRTGAAWPARYGRDGIPRRAHRGSRGRGDPAGRARHHSRGTCVPGAGVEGRVAARLPRGHGREAADRRREGAAGTPGPLRSRSAVGNGGAPPGRACRASRRCGLAGAGRLVTCNSTASSAACSPAPRRRRLASRCRRLRPASRIIRSSPPPTRPQFSRRMQPRATRRTPGITAHVIEPVRLQRSYVFRREDQAVLSGLEEALRNDLSMAVSDLLDAQVLAGDGTTGAEFDGFLATAANGRHRRTGATPPAASPSHWLPARSQEASTGNTPAACRSAPSWSATTPPAIWRRSSRPTTRTRRSPTRAAPPCGRWRARISLPSPRRSKRAFLPAWARRARTRSVRSGRVCS